MKRRYTRVTAALGTVLLTVALTTASQAATRPDAWVTLMIKMKLLTTEGVSVRDVNVDTIDGRVTLHGVVSSGAEKAKADEVARQVDGAREVRDLLQVVPGKTTRKEVAATDDQVKDRVQKALKADPALANSDVAVTSVTNGVVLLSGKARTLSEAYRAIDDAATVSGVRRVASEIQSPDTLADAELWRDGAFDQASYDKSTARDLWITTAAKMRLLADGKTPGFDINVDTNDRVVTLFGVVDSAAAKQAAETEVRKVGGVRQVVNDLQVVPAASKSQVAQSDDKLTDAIKTRLDEHALKDGDDISVAVSNGVARLSGTVRSRRDQLTAVTVAGSTSGVRRVIDDLRLETPAVSAR